MHPPRVTDLPIPRKSGWPWTSTDESFPLEGSSGQALYPRISIVTPSFNQIQFLEETIRSVLLQGYPNLEYIVMDGGSTDGSEEVIRQYEPFLSFVHVGPDGGQSAAIAEGFHHATGEILAWLNSDDRYCPNVLKRVANHFAANPSIVFANGDVNYVDSKGNFLERIYAIRPNWFLTANLGVHGWPQQGCFWRRQAYEKSGGLDKTLQFCMDRDLFIRLIKLGPSARIPGAPLADFRVHERAKSSTILDVAKMENDILLDRYGTPTWRTKGKLLNVLWRLWCQPSNWRSRVNKRLGWEW